MKTILIAGGTGLIGKRLIQYLKNDGYFIINLSRDINKSKTSLPQVNEHIDWNISNDSLADIINRVDIVINLSGTSLSGGRWSESYKNSIYQSRISTSGKIVQAINTAVSPPDVFINSSAVGYYGYSLESEFTENSSNGNDFVAEICRDWEAEALKASGKTRVVLARTGVVLDKNEGALAKMLPPYEFFIGGPVGSGKQWLSWIHPDDLINIFILCINNNDISGPVNFVSQNPVKMIDFAKSLGKTLKRPSFFKVPSFVIKVMFGEMSEIVLKGQKVIPAKIMEKGYEFQYSSLDDALADLLNS